MSNPYKRAGGGGVGKIPTSSMLSVVCMNFRHVLRLLNLADDCDYVHLSDQHADVPSDLETQASTGAIILVIIFLLVSLI